MCQQSCFRGSTATQQLRIVCTMQAGIGLQAGTMHGHPGGDSTGAQMRKVAHFFLPLVQNVVQVTISFPFVHA